MKAVLCPVCNGNGQVSAGFYSHPGDYLYWVSNGAGMEVCRSCNGKGWVEIEEASFAGAGSLPLSGEFLKQDPNKCPSCGGDRTLPAGTGCGMGNHYGTFCLTGG